MISRSMAASAPAARTARAFLSASASRPCAWMGSPSAAPPHEGLGCSVLVRGYASAALFLVAFFCATAVARACDLDHAPSTRWSIMRHGAISSLVTPCGDDFYSTGVNVLDGGITAGYLDRPHYDWRNSFASLSDWIADTKQRLADWGFNSAGAWSLPPRQLKLPSIINLELGRLARFHWFDPFDPAAEQRMFEQAKLLTEKYRDSPYRIGYFSDNEVGWWDGALFVFYGQKPATSFTKQRWT